jgi:hypothetical protein
VLRTRRGEAHLPRFGAKSPLVESNLLSNRRDLDRLMQAVRKMGILDDFAKIEDDPAKARSGQKHGAHEMPVVAGHIAEGAMPNVPLTTTSKGDAHTLPDHVTNERAQAEARAVVSCLDRLGCFDTLFKHLLSGALVMRTRDFFITLVLIAWAIGAGEAQVIEKPTKCGAGGFTCGAVCCPG